MVLAARTLPDGRFGEVIPLLFNRARLTVRRDPNTPWLDGQW